MRTLRDANILSCKWLAVAATVFTLSIACGSTPVRGDIIFTLSLGPSGSANMNIQASGTAIGTSDYFLIIGHPTLDTFLPDGFSEVYSSTPPSPMVGLAGTASQNYFYRDDQNSPFNKLQSTFGMWMGSAPLLDGSIDLSDLNGDYNLPGSSFSDFIPGTYTGLVSSDGNNALQGLGDVSMIVTVPEPGTLSLSAVPGLCLLIYLLRNRNDRNRR